MPTNTETSLVLSAEECNTCSYFANCVILMPKRKTVDIWRERLPNSLAPVLETLKEKLDAFSEDYQQSLGELVTLSIEWMFSNQAGERFFGTAIASSLSFGLFSTRPDRVRNRTPIQEEWRVRLKEAWDRRDQWIEEGHNPQLPLSLS